MDHNVFHVQHQDSGIITLANVFVQKRESGTAKTVFVNQDFTELIASAVHLKSIGMKQLKLVFAQLHLFGTVNTAHAQLDMIWLMVNAADVHLDMFGKTTNVLTAIVNI